MAHRFPKLWISLFFKLEITCSFLFTRSLGHIANTQTHLVLGPLASVWPNFTILLLDPLQPWYCWLQNPRFEYNLTISEKNLDHSLCISIFFILCFCLESNQLLSSPFKFLTCNKLWSASSYCPWRADNQVLSHSVLEQLAVANV